MTRTFVPGWSKDIEATTPKDKKTMEHSDVAPLTSEEHPVERKGRGEIMRGRGGVIARFWGQKIVGLEEGRGREGKDKVRVGERYIREGGRREDRRKREKRRGLG